MGDENTILTPTTARHLLSRTGFGALPADVTRYGSGGYTRGQAADELLGFTPKGFKPGGSDFFGIHDKWIKYMIKTKTPLQEKLVLFWHDHFATGIAKVGDPNPMAVQNKLLRVFCKGNMKALMKAINVDSAMIEWLDTQRNDKEFPNENYSRELLELFTLGVVDLAGQPNYLQSDIVQIARAFTGWRRDYSKGVGFFADYVHDYEADWPTRGPKEIFGGQSFTTGGEGVAEIGVVTDLIFAKLDSQGENAVARRTARRLFEYFGHSGFANPGVDEIAAIDAVIATSAFDTTFEIAPLLRAIFVHDEFYATSAAPGAGTKKSVKWPIDYVVSTLRVLRMKPKGKELTVEGGNYHRIYTHLVNMGQVLFDPPSVFGWDWELGWASSSTLLARYGFARDIISARDGGGRFKPELTLDVSLTAAGDIVDNVTEVLGVKDNLTTAERDVLIDYLGAPTLDLDDFDTRNEKLHGLVGLVLQSPAYQVH